MIIFTKHRIGLLLVGTLLLFPGMSRSGTRYFIPFSTTKVRPLALGGAFVSLKDDLPAFHYNPAAFELYTYKKTFRLTFHLNPVFSALALANYRNLTNDNQFGLNDLFVSLGLLIKSITISTEYFDIGLLLYDQSFRNHFVPGKIFDYSGFLDNNSSIFLFKLKLAERVQIGATGSIMVGMNRGKRVWGLGASYGALLRPSARMHVGIVYFDFPPKLRDYRVNLERFDDETLNIGASYKLNANTTLSLDVRNLTEDNKKASRELHLGLEHIFSSLLAIRTGFYREKISKVEVFSFGVGLLDQNRLVSLENQFSHRDYLLNYSFILERSSQQDQQWHLLSLIFRI